MRSCQLDSESKAEVLPFVIALVITAIVFAGLVYFNAESSGIRYGALGLGVVVTAAFIRGNVRESLQERFPNARATMLLSLGYALIAFGVIGQFVLEWLDATRLFYVFLLPAGLLIALFMCLNRGDADVVS